MKTNEYQKLIDSIVSLMGEKENILHFSHCSTRLRFNVKDKNAVDTQTAEKLPGVLGAQWVSDQYQLIIGPNVEEVYAAICEKYGFAVQAEVPADDVAPTTRSFLKNFSLKNAFITLVNTITDTITPLIPLLIASGLLKCVVIVGEELGLLDPSMSTYQVLTFCSDAAFYFLPIMVGATAARKFKTNIGLGMLMGAILIHPTFLSMIAEEDPITIFGLGVRKLSYTSQFFPVIISVYLLSYVERFFQKYSPKWISTITVPLCSALVMIPMTLCVCGPLGYTIGEYFSKIAFFMQDHLGFLFMGVITTVLPFLVLTGMHRVFVPYRAQSVATVGYDPFVTSMNFINNVNMGFACLAVTFKSKDAVIKANASSCAANALLSGITEPAMFGIVFKYKTPLIAVMIGNFFGGCYFGLTKIYCYAVGRAVIWGLPAYISPERPNNVLNVLIGLAIGLVVTFIATLILYRDHVPAVSSKQ